MSYPIPMERPQPIPHPIPQPIASPIASPIPNPIQKKNKTPQGPQKCREHGVRKSCCNDCKRAGVPKTGGSLCFHGYRKWRCKLCEFPGQKKEFCKKHQKRSDGSKMNGCAECRKEKNEMKFH
jgi:hypothetical protein